MKILSNIKNISIATIVLSIVIGLVFIFFPAQCMKYTALILGVGLIVVGLWAIISYFVKDSSVLILTLGIIVAICGIIICVKYKAIISLIMVVFGVFILTSGIVDLLTGIRSVFTFKVGGLVTIALSIATIVLGVLAITKSTQLSEGIVQMIGIALLVYAVLDTVAFVEVKRIVGRAKDTTEATGDIQTDAVVIEDADE